MTTTIRVSAVLALGAAALLAGCQSMGPAAQPVSAEPLPAPLRASGNEPGWVLRINETDGIRFDAQNAGDSFRAAAYRARVTPEDTQYQAEGPQGAVRIRVVPGGCMDSMADMAYPYSVEVVHGSRAWRGCGGDTAALLTASEWRVTQLGDTVIPAEGAPTITFAPDGAVSGFAGCNRFGGRYTVDGEALRLEGMFSTRMACEPPRMALEDRFLKAVDGVRGFASVAAGQVTLLGTDDQPIMLVPTTTAP